MFIHKALLAAAVAVAVAGCGSGEEEPGDAGAIGDPEDADALVEAAGDAFLDLSAHGDVTVDGLVFQEFGLDSDTLDDISMVMSIDEDGDFSYAFDMELADIAGIPDDTEIEIRHVHREDYFSNYIGLPAEAVASAGLDVIGDTAWLTISPETVRSIMLACGTGMPVVEEDNVVPCNPLEDVATLAERAEDASIVGSEDVAGTPTTLVRFHVPVRDLIIDTAPGADDLGMDAEDAEVIEEMVDMFSMNEENVDVELWIDDEGMPRRVVVDASSMFKAVMSVMFGVAEDGIYTMFGGDEGGEDVLVRTTMEFYDFDAVSDIVAPPTESIIAHYDDLQDTGLFSADDPENDI